VSDTCLHHGRCPLKTGLAGIELAAVTINPSADNHQGEVERATVFVPEGNLKHFVSRFERYAPDIPKKKAERRYEDMIDRIAGLRLATLRALWTDSIEAFPGDNEKIWWKIWLRRQQKQAFQ
jgi:hypothetical protein